MRYFRSPFRFVKRRSLVTTLKTRPSLEALESRLAPANAFVVPPGQVSDGSHFHTLAEAIVAAGQGGLVTIEPGASPDPTQPVSVAESQFDGLTIQGDPSVPASILPQEQLTVDGGGITLTNLNLGSLSLDAVSSGDTVSKCLIVNLSESARNSNVIQNTIIGSAHVQPHVVVFPSNGNVLIANNTFSSSAQDPLTIGSCTGVTVTGNTFFGGPSTDALIGVADAGTSSAPITITNNTIATLAGDAIHVDQNVSGGTFVRILNNAVSTHDGNAGVGVTVSTDVDHFNVLVQGNDFHNARFGVDVFGDGTSVGNIDLGGGTLGSLGGNNFRRFTLPANENSAAIVLANAPQGTIVAQQNIFANGVDPASLVSTTGVVDLTNLLNNNQAFVQTLYNNLLGRTGALAELDPWVQMLNAQGQSAVANAILHSPEALGRIVDSFYLRFLGRQSDAGGRAGWITFLQNGGTEEQLETQFLTSPEYISHINTDFVQSLYLNILGRPGSPEELAGWNNNIQNFGGLASVANAFVTSVENRANTVQSDFQTFLHRGSSATETASLANSSLNLLSLEQLVLSSPEFFGNG